MTRRPCVSHGRTSPKLPLEREDAAVEGDERRAVGVAVLLVPDGDAVDLLVGHVPRRRCPLNSSVRWVRGFIPGERGTPKAWTLFDVTTER